ncbi:MAG: hypothetical protein AAF621_03060 [Pseudomonadota bacterium]
MSTLSNVKSSLAQLVGDNFRQLETNDAFNTVLEGIVSEEDNIFADGADKDDLQVILVSLSQQLVNDELSTEEFEALSEAIQVLNGVLHEDETVEVEDLKDLLTAENEDTILESFSEFDPSLQHNILWHYYSEGRLDMVSKLLQTMEQDDAETLITEVASGVI